MIKATLICFCTLNLHKQKLLFAQYTRYWRHENIMACTWQLTGCLCDTSNLLSTYYQICTWCLLIILQSVYKYFSLNIVMQLLFSCFTDWLLEIQFMVNEASAWNKIYTHCVFYVLFPICIYKCSNTQIDTCIHSCTQVLSNR